MANFIATLDLHKETHQIKNVADNEFTPAVTAAAKGIFCCSKHPGFWMSRPIIKMMIITETEVRDCPACSTEKSSSSDLPLSSLNLTTVQGKTWVVKAGLVAYFVIRIYSDCSIYEGDFKDGRRNGKGKYMWADGRVYEGDWVDDRKNGKGKYTWPTGRVYYGDFKDNNFHGKGKNRWPSGATYDGSYKNNKRNGLGKYTYPSGEVSEGYWKDGEKVSIFDYYRRIVT